MRAKFAGRLVVPVLAAMIASIPVEAAATKTAGSVALPASISQGVRGRVANRTTPSVRQLKPQFKTPFDRYVAPRLTQMLSAKRAAGAARATRSHSFAETGAGGGTNPNLPSFVAAPFTTLSSDASNDGSSVYSSVTGDFNNDGKPDFVTAQAGGTLTTFLNPGTFQDIANITPLAPNTSLNNQIPNLVAIVAADLNGDGNLDIIGQDAGEDQIVVWIGNGDGTFGTCVTYPIAPKSGANWFQGGVMAVGDFNGDGHLDIAALSLGVNYNFPSPITTSVTLQSYLNDGTGKLTLPTTETDALFQDLYVANPQQGVIVTADGSKPSGIVFLLFDYGSGKPANVGESVNYVASNGDGTFTVPQEPAFASIPIASLDGSTIVTDEGFSSFFATNLSETISPSARVKGKAAPSANPGSPTTDIVFAVGDGAVYDIPFKPGTSSVELPAPTILAGANANNLSATAQAHASGSKAATKRNAALPVTGTPIPYEGLLNLADMNNDGVLDLVVYTAGSTLIYPGKGSGTFGVPTQVVGGIGGDEQPQPADYDGSGYNSFIWTDAYLNHIGYYQNLGATNAADAGAFYAAPPVAGSAGTYNALGGNILVQDAGDFNGDGLLDVIAYDLTNVPVTGVPDIVLGINNGQSNAANQINNFTFSTIIPGSALIGLNAAYVEPITIRNGTGNSFLLATGGGMLLYTADAKGNFGVPSALSLGVHIDCTLNYGDTGDINGDGAADLVIAYGGDASCEALGSTPSGYFTFLGNGSGGFLPGTFTPFGNSLYMVKLINFSGAAGNLDLAADDLDNIDSIWGVYVAPNNADGSGTFNTQFSTEAASGFIVSDIVPGDFNNDGRQDLTLTTEGKGIQFSFAPEPDTTGVLQIPMIGTSYGSYVFGSPNLIDAGYYPIWGSYADFNGDGYPDLVVSTVETAYGLSHPFSFPPDVPLVQIMPSQQGAFGPVLTEVDSAQDVQASYTFTGNFGNTGGNDLLVTSNVNTAEFLNQGANSLTLTASAATALQGAAITLTATVSQAASGYAASGSVLFQTNGTTIGAAPITGGATSITVTTLPVGADRITATYSGDEHHNISTANLAISVGAVAPMFTLATNTSNLALQAGATGTVTLTLASNSTFNAAVTFSCSGAPNEATCTVNPTNVTLGASQTAIVSVIVATTAKNNQYQASSHGSGSGLMLLKGASGLSLAGLACFLLPRRRKLYRSMGVLAFALLSLASLAAVTGCGSSGNQYPGTPAGNSTITVTATSGSITQTQVIGLSVTQKNQ